MNHPRNQIKLSSDQLTKINNHQLKVSAKAAKLKSEVSEVKGKEAVTRKDNPGIRSATEILSKLQARESYDKGNPKPAVPVPTEAVKQEETTPEKTQWASIMEAKSQQSVLIPEQLKRNKKLGIQQSLTSEELEKNKKLGTQQILTPEQLLRIKKITFTAPAPMKTQQPEQVRGGDSAPMASEQPSSIDPSTAEKPFRQEMPTRSRGSHLPVDSDVDISRFPEEMRAAMKNPVTVAEIQKRHPQLFMHSPHSQSAQFDPYTFRQRYGSPQQIGPYFSNNTPGYPVSSPYQFCKCRYSPFQTRTDVSKLNANTRVARWGNHGFESEEDVNIAAPQNGFQCQQGMNIADPHYGFQSQQGMNMIGSMNGFQTHGGMNMFWSMDEFSMKDDDFF